MVFGHSLQNSVALMLLLVPPYLRDECNMKKELPWFLQLSFHIKTKWEHLPKESAIKQEVTSILNSIFFVLSKKLVSFITFQSVSMFKMFHQNM